MAISIIVGIFFLFGGKVSLRSLIGAVPFAGQADPQGLAGIDINYLFKYIGTWFPQSDHRENLPPVALENTINPARFVGEPMNRWNIKKGRGVDKCIYERKPREPAERLPYEKKKLRAEIASSLTLLAMTEKRGLAMTELKGIAMTL